MPPRGHSSSSHSSSRSSGSRSSFSSSRSSSSRSSSSRSSSSRSSSSGSSSFRSSSSRSSSYSRPSPNAFRSRPSGHSTSSHSSTYTGPVYQNRTSGTRSADPGRKPRTSQPLYSRKVNRPIMYYGVLHDYLYFSEPWDCNGTHYEAGYYDENGVRYDSVVMKNESGDNTVTITCQYCGSTVKIDWKEGDLPACSHCGAPLQLEDVQSDTISSSRQYGDPVTDNSEKESPDNSKKHSRLGRILLLLIAVITGLGVRSVFRASDIQTPEEIGNTESAYVTTTDSNTQIYGTSVYLTESSDGIYELSGKDSYTKVLTWDQETECYYDSSSGAYLWYNTDMTPALWQYWFEGISSRYDSGWMEYENGTWYIETREGEWEEYTGSTAGLWHIENRFDS